MSDSDERPDDGLDDNWVDKTVAVTKGAAGLVPLFGGPLAEVIGVAIPGQRADRIATYVRQLSARLDEIDADLRNGLASSTEKIDLIEEGGYQAARATSRERIERIVAAVQRDLPRMTPTSLAVSAYLTCSANSTTTNSTCSMHTGVHTVGATGARLSG